MKNGNRYSFNPHRKIIPQIVAMRTEKFGYTLIVHLASNPIGPNRNYYCILTQNRILKGDIVYFNTHLPLQKRQK